MILSDAEIYKRCERSIPTMQDVAKIQHAETLRQLEKNKMLKHDVTADNYGGSHHSPACRACAALREVGA